MNEEIFKKHELKEAFRVLDALQIRTDNLIYSKESPGQYKERGNEHILNVFGVPSLSNSEVDKILKEVQKNYVELAKEILQEEPQ